MSSSILSQFLERWELSKSNGAKVLKIQKSRVTEYLKEQKTIPPYILAHIETFNTLPKSSGKRLIEERLSEK